MRKDQKKKASLLLGLLISTVIFTIISVSGRFSIYEDYSLNLWKQPTLTVMFEAVKDGIYPWELIQAATKETMTEPELDYVAEDTKVIAAINGQEDTTIAQKAEERKESSQGDDQEQVITEVTPTEGIASENTSSEDKQQENEEEKKEEILPEELSQVMDSEIMLGQVSDKDIGFAPTTDSKTGLDETTDRETELEKSDDTGKLKGEDCNKEDIGEDEEQAEPVSCSIGEVTLDYFDDVLFIGDSRTVGLSEYSYLSNATYYCDTGLSVYTVFDRKIAKVDHKMMTIEKALKKKEFKKIYIMLGVNELGTGTAKTFAAKYQEMLDRIQELEPNAKIVVQAIMMLGKKLSDTDKIYNNPKIEERNAELKKLADHKRIFYLDINEVLVDENGYLPDEHTFDSIHLLAKYYDVWADYLMSHGIIEN